MLECPLYYFIRVKFQALFENVVAWCLKSFFQLDHQVNNNLYLMETTTLCHCRESTGLTPSWCTFSHISLLASSDFKINFISFHFNQSIRPFTWLKLSQNLVSMLIHAPPPFVPHERCKNLRSQFPFINQNACNAVTKRLPIDASSGIFYLCE